MRLKRDQVIITRPEPGLAKTIKAVNALGWKAVSSPLFSIQPESASLPDIQAVDLLVFTSAQAIIPTIQNYNSCYHKVLFTIPVFTVGDNTAVKASAAGFKNVISAHGDAIALAELIIQKHKEKQKNILLPCGKGMGGILTNQLQNHGFHVFRREVYSIHPYSSLSDQVIASIQQDQVNAILFFSEKTADLFLQLSLPEFEPYFKSIRAIVMSPKIATVFQTHFWKSIEIAKQPDFQSILLLLKAND